jgi:hypothetical protein
VLWPAWICGDINAVNIVVCTGGGTVLHHSLSTCLLRPCMSGYPNARGPPHNPVVPGHVGPSPACGAERMHGTGTHGAPCLKRNPQPALHVVISRHLSRPYGAACLQPRYTLTSRPFWDHVPSMLYAHRACMFSGSSVQYFHARACIGRYLDHRRHKCGGNRCCRCNLCHCCPADVGRPPCKRLLLLLRLLLRLPVACSRMPSTFIL